MASPTRRHGPYPSILVEVHGRTLTLRQVSDIYGIRYSTIHSRYHMEGRRGLELVDRTRLGDYDNTVDFIRACARRGHSQKYARQKLGCSIKKWYLILSCIEPLEWLPVGQTIEALQSRARYSDAMRTIRANRVRMHRCSNRECRARHRLPKHIDEYGEGKAPKCKTCGSTLVLDKWADERSWRNQNCHCDAYPYPHHRDGGRCFATEREQILADQIDRAPPHVLDAVFD